MTEVEPALDFASSGRSGRRNALPDILGSPAGVKPSDLPLTLAELSLTGPIFLLTRLQTNLVFNLLHCSFSEDGSGGAQSPASQETPIPLESLEEKQ